MKKKILLLSGLFFFFLSINSYAQLSPDSLLLVLDEAKTEESKAEAAYGLANFYIYEDNKKSIEFAQKGLVYSAKCDGKKIEYKLLNVLAWATAETGDFEAATVAAKKILANEKSYGIADAKAGAFRLLGFVYAEQLLYKKSLEAYHQSLKEAKKIGNTSDIGGAYSDIARIYQGQKDKENARKFYMLAIKQLQKEGSNRLFLANTLSNYSRIVEDEDEKLALIDSCITIYQSFGQNGYVASGLIDKGRFYYKQNEFSKALEFYRESFALLPENALERDFVKSYMAITFYELGKMDSVLFYGEPTLNALSKAGRVHLTKALLKTLTLAYLETKNFDKAVSYLKQTFDLSDSISSIENKAQNAKFNALFENEEKEKEITAQQLEIERQKNIQNITLLGGVLAFLLALAIFLIFYYRQRNKKQSIEFALQNEQKTAERLRELDRLKSSFFTNISHELRTPLTLVAAPLDDALQTVKPGLLKNQLQLAHSNTQKLRQLVNEILDLSKLEAGKLVVKTKDVHLLSLSRRIFYSFESIAQLREISLSYESNIASDLVVKLDEEKFEKILNNLLSNAMKFTDSGGKVTCKITQKEHIFQFEIEDTGAGIAPEELPRIFDRFYQVNAPGAALQGGSGIGLALAKELAQLLKGNLKVESYKGKGSRFILELPLEQTTIVSDEIISNPKEVAPRSTEMSIKATYTSILLNGQKPRLLIVEDNLEMGRYLEQSLKKDYHCTTAQNGEDALNKLRNATFDLITSDVMMPNMDGFTFRQKVNEHYQWKYIPFIMITARAMEEDKLRGFRLGVDDYITKPFSVRELKARIDNLLLNKIERDTFAETTKETTEPSALAVDEQLLLNAEAYVLKRLDDTQLKVEDLAKNLQYSNRQLSRTLRKLTGMPPVQFILELRLQKARQLLESQRFRSVAEVRYKIGIESPSYFTTKFKERFGLSPKEMLTRW